MTKYRATKTLIQCLALWALTISADECNDGLLEDPAFDLWCGETLCAWQVEEGHIAKTASWHDDDYAVALETVPTAISQLSTQAGAACLRVELIADVAAETQTALELDFNDDGSVEQRRDIPEASWKKLSYVIETPAGYERVRFRFRKRGEGRSVLARIVVRKGECNALREDG